MGIEENKAIIKDFFAKFTLTDIDRALDMLADDVIWRLVGEPRRFRYAGAKDKAGFTELIKDFLGGLSEFRWVPNVMTAEDDRVAVEAETFGQSADGKKYHNFYHIIFVVRDGKIQNVREFMDPLEVFEFTGEMTFPT